MTKRIIALLLIIGMVFVGTGICFARTNIMVDVYSVKGITVIQNRAEYTDSHSLYLNFDILNSTEDDMNISVILNITDIRGNVLSDAELSRCIGAGKSIPFKFSSSDNLEEDVIYVKLNVRLPEVNNAIYVSESGSDLNRGTYSSPYKTVDKAVERLSQMNNDENYTGEDITIIMEGGRYIVDDTVCFENYDNLNSVTLTTNSSDTVISSGASFKGNDFEKVTDNDILRMFPENARGKIYSIDLAAYGLDNFSAMFKNGTKQANDPIFTQLYIDGRDAQMARYPNDGYAVADVTLEGTKTITEIVSNDIKDWEYADEAWVRGWFVYDWDLNKAYVSRIDSVNKKISFNKCFTGFSGTDAGVRKDKKWYIYNLPDELDSEGEYVIYKNVLYYYPNEIDVINGIFENSTVNLNISSNTMFEISETNNLTIEGLTFENSKGYFINANTDNLQILGCTFRNNSSNAVYVNGNGNTVYACDFINLGGRGLSITGGDRNTLTPSGSVVDNCLFDTVSQINRTNCSPLYVGGCGVIASHNTIRNNPHSSVSFGGNENIMEYNDISMGLTDGSMDAGLFYAGRNLSNLGNRIRYNHIHDSNGGMAAVYYDDFLSGQYCEHNLFENMANGNYTAVFFHAGVNNEFSENIVIDANIGVRIRGKGTFTGGYVREWNESYNDSTFLDELKTLPWQSEIWQSKYGETLRYVNNKTTRVAEGNKSTNNVFVNVNDEIYSYDAGQKDSDLIQSGNRMISTPDAETTARAEELRAQCGIYYDPNYRPYIR